MIERIVSLIAPHHCIACQREGSLLCAECFDELLDRSLPACIHCSQPTALEYLCSECRSNSPIDGVWITGLYEKSLRSLLYTYKFERAKDAYKPLADLLLEAVPQIPSSTIVVNVPTIPRHIRQRGYDQTALIAKYFAKSRSLSYKPLLQRVNNTRQLGASRAQRLKQAENMFKVSKKIDPSTVVLLIDDVVTTGATVTAAAKALKQAGAQHVFVAACAYESSRK